MNGLIQSMRAIGIDCTEPDRITADGEIHRFHVEGDRRGDRNGWAVIFRDPDGIGGAFGSWKLGMTGTWHEKSRRGLSMAERMRLKLAMQAERERHAREQRKRAEAAQKRAYSLWNRANSADPKHPYLQRKGVNPWDIRQTGSLLIIPLHDAAGVLWSLEFISADGEKRFLKDGAKRGHFFQINQPQGRIMVAEGFATAASVYEDCGDCTVCAFDAGNLEPVCRILRQAHPHDEIIVCADADAVGIAKANTAARAVGGTVLLPPEGYGDFNDAAVAGGVR